MFGFLQAPSAPCCGRTPEIWRSHFCGLATRMHQDFGPWAKFLINRNSTFLALAGSQASAPEMRVATCCNPFSTPKTIADSSRAVEYGADITLCALGIKLKDDACDEGWARRVLAKVGAKSLQPAIDKAIARLNTHGFPTAEVEKMILAQTSIEAAKPDALAASQPTAEAYGEIFAQIPGSTTQLWQRTGASLGRLIYWDDAWKDWTKDRKQGRFNPLSQSPAPELRELMVAEFATFQDSLGTLPSSPVSETLLQVASETEKNLPSLNEHPALRKDRQRRKKQERKERRNNCCESACTDPCNSAECGWACCDFTCCPCDCS